MINDGLTIKYLANIFTVIKKIRFPNFIKKFFTLRELLSTNSRSSCGKGVEFLPQLLAFCADKGNYPHQKAAAIRQ
jgi:hypothetical protein